MKVSSVTLNNRRRVFEVRTDAGTLDFPYAKLDRLPTRDNPIQEAWPDEELGCEGFTCRFASGAEDTVHVDAVLEYNRDPAYMKDLILHNLTVEALEALKRSNMSKRELIRRLGTSASQFYRLLDTAYYAKSIGQMVALLHLLDCDVQLVVRPFASARKKVAVSR